jgi:AbiEi antitoxin C-terminal domain
VLSYQQLVALGLRRGSIEHWLRSGRLHRVHVSVYAVGHSVLGNRGRLMAAVLASGPDAVVSHRSAADLWGIRPTAGKRIDVTVPGRTRKGRPGIDLHLVRSLDPRDVTTEDGIPVTTVARTLLDLAEVTPQRHVARAIEQADRLRVFDRWALEQTMARSPGRRGLKPLRSILTDAVIEPRSRSELETAFLQFCHDRGIPRPIVNTLVAGYEADMAWHDARVVIELDGFESHGTRKAFEDDRRKDAVRQIAGQRTIRVTDRWLTREPDDLEETVKALLRASCR